MSRPSVVLVGVALLAVGCTAATEAPQRAEGPAASQASEGSGRPASSATASEERAAAPPPRRITVVELHERIRERGAPVTVVNIWATWCVPCRKEMPALIALREGRAADGVKLELVSADFDLEPEEIASQLTELGVDFPTWLKDDGDQEFIDGLSPEWQGALPATFLYDSEGRLQAFLEGAQTHEAFDRAVDDVLDAS